LFLAAASKPRALTHIIVVILAVKHCFCRIYQIGRASDLVGFYLRDHGIIVFYFTLYLCYDYGSASVTSFASFPGGRMLKVALYPLGGWCEFGFALFGHETWNMIVLAAAK
jgi:hypothetical protein